MAVLTGLASGPLGLSWRLLADGGLLAGIGFTIALFIANLAFDASKIDSAKLGILLVSVASSTAGIALLFTFSKNEQHPLTEPS